MKKLACSLLALLTFAAQAQFIEHEERDKRYLIPSDSDTNTPNKVGLFTHLAEILPSCKVSKSSQPKSLSTNYRDLSSVEYKGLIFNSTLGNFIKNSNTMAITFVRDEYVLYKKFNYERRDSDLFTSFSMAKSMISIMIGIALDEGLIKDLDDPVHKYTSRINDSSYSKISIKSLLRMSSGIPFSQVYRPGKHDIYFLSEDLKSSNSEVPLILNKWQRPSNGEGKKFYYAGIETVVLAETLRGAIGKGICQFMQEKIWEPLGAEYDAYWITDSKGNVIGKDGFNATHLDYAKVGVMLANKGVYNGKRIVSEKYLDEATNVNRQPEGFKYDQADQLVGYGYQFWLLKQPGRYQMRGVYGQYLMIDTDSKSVMIISSIENNEITPILTLNTRRLFNSLIEATNLNQAQPPVQ